MLVTQELVHEDKVHSFSAEASELGLRPGEWPRRLETTLGNGQPFILMSKKMSGCLYLQANGCISLRVFND